MFRPSVLVCYRYGVLGDLQWYFREGVPEWEISDNSNNNNDDNGAVLVLQVFTLKCFFFFSCPVAMSVYSATCRCGICISSFSPKIPFLSDTVASGEESMVTTYQ